jgi:ribosome-binding factor A
MAKDPNRMQRVGDVLQKELATLIRREIRDPRIGMVTISGISVTPDFSYAKIFVTFLTNTSQDDSETIKTNLHALNKASSFLRCLLAKKLMLRKIPQLKFVYDSALEKAWHVDELLSVH